MSTENTTEPLIKSARKWWIRFNKDNGKILGISSRQQYASNANELVISSNSKICKDIAVGKVKVNNYAVIWDVANDCWDLDKKSTTLKIEVRDNKLRPFQQLLPTESDIFVKVYKEQNLLDIRINFENIRIHKNLGEILHISTVESNLLDLYITKKNDPDYLISVVKVDSTELCNNQKLLISISAHKQAIDWNNISIYTKPVFFKYGIEYAAAITDSAVDKNKHLLYNVAVDDPTKSNINIVNKNNKLYVTSTLTASQLYYFNSKSKFKVTVSDRDIDAYVGTLTFDSLDLIDLTKEKILDIGLENWPEQPLLTHNNKHITVSYTKHGD